jgi:hypothetical protein
MPNIIPITINKSEINPNNINAAMKKTNEGLTEYQAVRIMSIPMIAAQQM